MLKSILILLVVSINQNISCQSLRDDAIVLLESATTYAQMEDLEHTLADLNEAIRLNPIMAMAHEIRGLCKANQNDLEGACEVWHKSLQLGSKSVLELMTDDCK